MTVTAMRGTSYARHRGGLLVPADVLPIRPDVRLDLPAAPAPAVVEEAEETASVQVDERPEAPEVAPEPDGPGKPKREPVSADELRERLAAERAVVEARREHERTRREADVEHRLALADVDELAAETRRERRDRARDAREAAELKRYYQRASRAGVRARIRADIDRSAEMRALRVTRVRTATLVVGLAALVAFAAWSTAGVQAGVGRLLDLEHGSAGWWAAWGMEPALMAVVALIIISRALLESSGGRTDNRSYVVEWAALGTSIALNAAGGTYDGGKWEVLGALLAHSVGPVGAAGVAYLIGLLLEYVSQARPWDGAPRLADLLQRPAGADVDGPPEVINLRKLDQQSTAGGGRAEAVEALSEADREVLHSAAMVIESGAMSPGPSGWSIYQRVMDGRGDKGRAYRVARLLQNWRPGQPVPGMEVTR